MKLPERSFEPLANERVNGAGTTRRYPGSRHSAAKSPAFCYGKDTSRDPRGPKHLNMSMIHEFCTLALSVAFWRALLKDRIIFKCDIVQRVIKPNL